MTDQPWRLENGGHIDRSRMLRFAFDGKIMEGHPGDMVPVFVMNAARVIPQVNEIMPFLRRRGVGILGIILGGVATVSELHQVTLAAPRTLDQQHGESS